MLDHLWNGWRAAYVTNHVADRDATPGEGSVFTRILRSGLPDRETNIVHRGDMCFAIMNAFPYTSGHLMVLPYRHVAELEDLTAAESSELMAFTQQAVRSMREVAAPHAFNVGINLGTVAGGSLAEHLHQHVGPRWGGDANFIAVVGQTKVIPQLLSETRALLAEAWPGRSGAGH